MSGVLVASSTRVDGREAFAFSPVGLATTRTPTFEEWEALGIHLALVEGALQWWIGDWLNIGEAAFGERASQAMDATGWELKTVLQYRWVAAAVPFDRRRPALSFSHHREVADLGPADQARWLDRAQAGDGASPWGVNRLRLALNSERRGDQTLWVVVEARDADDAEALVLRFQSEGRRAKVR